jgi:hypothetical protein
MTADLRITPARVRLAVLCFTAAGTLAGFFAGLRINLIYSIVSGGVALALPLASLGLVLLWPSLFDKPFMGRGLNPLVAAPAITLSLSSLDLDRALIHPSQALTAGALGMVCGGVIAGIVIARQPRLSGRLQFGVTVAATAAVYAYSALFVVDLNADGSRPTLLRVILAGKHEAAGRNGPKSQIFDLPAWGPAIESTSVVVDQPTYDAVQPGEPVCVLLHPGTVGIAWYQVRVCPA